MVEVLTNEIKADEPLDLQGTPRIPGAQTFAIQNNTLVVPTVGTLSKVSLVDEFLGGRETTTAIGSDSEQSNFGELGWVFRENTLGGSGTAQVIAGETNHPGILRIGTGADDGGGIILGYRDSGGSGAVGFGPMNRSNTILEVIMRHTSSATSALFVGLITGLPLTSYSDNTSKIGFFYDGTDWVLATADGSNATEYSTGKTVVINTWYKLKLVINNVGNTVEFFIDGVSFGEINTTIPTASGSPMIAGTNSSFDVDFFGLSTEVTR